MSGILEELIYYENTETNRDIFIKCDMLHHKKERKGVSEHE